MTLKIKNTLSKEKEIFEPLEKGKVKFYQCGPTLYWNQHIGNLRSVVIADLINKSLNYLGYEVNFVRNYTDVGHLSGDNEGDADTGEDRMEKAVKRENQDPNKIAQKYQGAYEIDIKKLNTTFPNSAPKATEYIEEQIEMIKTLLAKDFAYVTPLAVYFDTSKAKDYNRLSGQSIENNLCGAGTGEITDENKKHSNDFVLWFFKAGAHSKALQTWTTTAFASPLVEYGEGFPGWHLECSAMGKALLGNTLDLKMGGIEHISIHHTNEIAQSENANDAEYVKYWLHNEHLLVDGKKMSKSEGTSFTLSDIEEKGYSPLDLRYFFLQAHYRSKQNFTWDALEASKNARLKLNKKVSSFSDNGKIDINFKEQFIEKIKDDFSIPEALAIVWEILKSDILDEDKKSTILDFDKILGLKINEFEKEEIEISNELQEILNKRKEARENKNWEESDKLRDEIKELGFNILDKENEQILKNK